MPNLRQCPLCGTNFEPRCGRQKYCCKECAKTDRESRKKRQQGFALAVEPVMNVSQQEYLTFSKAAVLMGCSRQYIYKLVAQGRLPASRLSSRMAVVRRSDIELMLDAYPYERVLPTARASATDMPTQDSNIHSLGDEKNEYYSGEDIMATYKVKRSWLYTASKRYGIPVCRIAGRVYFSKRHVDEHFGSAVDSSAVSEWISLEEAAATYNITIGSIRSYVYRHKVPSKRQDGQLFYSKCHLDEARKTELFDGSIYYTVEDIQHKYGLSKANINKIAIEKNIRKVRVGVRNLLLIEDVERVMAERAARGL
jgi:excisionase family DNA binding protein